MRWRQRKQSAGEGDSTPLSGGLPETLSEWLDNQSSKGLTIASCSFSSIE